MTINNIFEMTDSDTFKTKGMCIADTFKTKGMCIASVLKTGMNILHGRLIYHEGGEIKSLTKSGGLNMWEEEMDCTSDELEDIFCGYEYPNDTPGLYVWEGELEYVHNDQPIFCGVWRKANKEDLKKLLPDEGE